MIIWNVILSMLLNGLTLQVWRTAQKGIKGLDLEQNQSVPHLFYERYGHSMNY